MFDTKGHRFTWRDPLDVTARYAETPGTLLLYSSDSFRERAPRSLCLFGPEAVFDSIEAAKAAKNSGLIAGLLNYEYGHQVEDIPPARDTPVPRAINLMAYRMGFKFDSAAREVRAFGQTRAAAYDALNKLPDQGPSQSTAPSEISPRVSRKTYEAAVRTAVAYIHAGDIFQVNLSQGFDVVLAKGDTPYQLYRRLMTSSPSPYSMYFRPGPDHAVISNSPERFIKLSVGGQIMTRPIKGTRARGATPESDRTLASELVRSEKDRAENLMIVDLMRNDISRLSVPGSVQVPDLFKLESYANVHHLVSTITGQLKPGATPYDVLRATFPPGSITGAPKVRAMEIISELEDDHRGPYCGAVGYISPRGQADFNVMIRTLDLHFKDGRWRGCFRSGGGIVADSDPAMEYEETLSKAASIAAAIRAGDPL